MIRTVSAMVKAAAAIAILAAGGCVVVSDNKWPVNTIRDRQAVIKDGELYIVNVRDCTIEHIPWSPTESTETTETPETPGMPDVAASQPQP